MAPLTQEEFDESRRRHEEQLERRRREGRLREGGEDAAGVIDTENNPGELVLALKRINLAMRERGWSYERAARAYGIRGHPRFADFWPVTRYWGDARRARIELGLPLDE
jgi:hypothetical protein